MTVHYRDLPVKVKQCISASHLCTYVQKNVEFMFVLQYLERNGYLKFFESNSKLLIFPVYSTISTKPVLNKFLLMTSPSCRNYIGIRQIKVMMMKNRGLRQHNFILTRDGLVTMDTAYKSGVGGEFIYSIS